MDKDLLLVELKKGQNYCVIILALTTALIIFTVMLTVRVMTGNHILTLASGAITFCVILIVMTALKAQRNSILMHLTRVKASAPVPEKKSSSVYNDQGKVPGPPRLGEAGPTDAGQHADLQA